MTTPASTPTGQPTPTRGRARRATPTGARASTVVDDETLAPVAYLSDHDRLARRQGRIRTTSGRFLRPLTDRGNCERYIDAHAGELVYVAESGAWREYNGRNWVDSCLDRELHRRLGVVLREIYTEAEQCRSDDAKKVRRWAASSEDGNRFIRTKRLLAAECAVNMTDFDRQDDGVDRLNLANGTLNLATFELAAHRARDMLSKCSPVAYDPTATCPAWLAHLEWAIPDPDTRETVQRYLGYCLTSETREQKMLCFYGAKGRNGKGVIIRAMERLMGYDPKVGGSEEYSYAQTAPATLLISSKRSPGAAEPELARLVGKRFVSLSETAAGQKFDDTRLKELTGGDAISTRLLHRNLFQFTPVAKYILLTNHRPEVHGDDPATWRRLFLVNFPNSISDAGMDSDPGYEDRIHAELPGILNWLLDGLRKWREGGLAISEAIRADTAAYRAEQDVFGGFMDDCCEPAYGHLVKKSALYAVYREWAQNNGYGVCAQKRFKEQLKPKVPGLYEKRAGHPAEHYYGGIRLREGIVAPIATIGPPANPVQRPDPGQPPVEHVEAYARLREPEHPSTPAPAAETAEGVGDSPCVEGHHEQCAGCGCECHDDGGLWVDDDPPPDDLDDTRNDDQECPGVEDYGDGDTGVEVPDFGGAPRQGSVADVRSPVTSSVSVRRIMPWTVKPSAYVDVGTGRGVVDSGAEFVVAKRGRVATVAELLTAIPAAVKYVYLTGTMPGDGKPGAVDTWAHGLLPVGWSVAERGIDGDDERSHISLCYRRPDFGGQLTVYRAGAWVGDVESDTTPEQLAAATALVTRGLKEVFGEVCAGHYGVPIKSTPAATGLELMHRTLPRGHEFPVLDDPTQRLIRTVGGQARIEDYAALTHPSGGRYLPDEIPGLYVYDMRFAYAALLDHELPCGPVESDTTPEFAYTDNGKSWQPCLYELQVRVPEEWDRPGRFRRRGAGEVWIYPDTPGETFTTWAWEHSVAAANADGWRLGEHVRILRRMRFTGPKTKPLTTFGRNMRTLRDDWIPRRDADARVREIARVMARQITIAAIGKLSGTPYAKLHSTGLDSPRRPDDAWLSQDGKRWEWCEWAPGNGHLAHPEWSSHLWAVAREWLYDHPAQPGVGLRHVPRGELVVARTDGYWTSTPQPVIDTGKVGHFRPQLEYDRPLATPRSTGELNRVRKQLLVQEVLR